MKYLLILLLVPIIILPAFAQTNSQTLPTEKGTLDVKLSYDDINPGDQSRLLIQFINPQTQKIQEHIDYRLTVSKDGESIFGPIPLTHTSSGEVKGLKVEFVEEGNHKVDFEVEGILFQPIPLETVSFDIPVGDASAQSDVTSQEEFSDVVVVSVPEGTSLQGCEGTNECYIPYEARVNVGGKVVWLNEDMAFHTVTSGNSGEGPDDLFDSGMFTKDEQFSHTFENSGNYDYFCTLHPWMEGVVIVLETMAEDPSKDEGGGCLIATATYGSELAPQVQILRELRDNKLLQTESGTAFMQGFNDFYYSFSPHIADYERENPYFKEAVKITLTPMISSLSILNYVDMDSEAEVLGYGISLILLNVGMYVGAPAMVIFGIKKRF
ncbi:MAG: CFI-box-CTERM domain-containing protein [Nitrosopumilaceae archaeon]